MAVTKFSVVKENKNTGELLIINYAGEWTYNTALAIAKEANREFDEKGWKIVCVVESWKLYPKENEKTKKKDNVCDTE